MTFPLIGNSRGGTQINNAIFGRASISDAIRLVPQVSGVDIYGLDHFVPASDAGRVLEILN